MNRMTDSDIVFSERLAGKVIKRLAGMDRTEELCLVTAAICAFGSAIAAQKRHD